MKKKFFSVSYWLTASLAFLGVSCDYQEEVYGPPFQYARMLGTITNQDGKPIPGLKVTIGDSKDSVYVLTTDKNGYFESPVMHYSYTRFIIQDADNPEDSCYYFERNGYIPYIFPDSKIVDRNESESDVIVNITMQNNCL